MIGEQIKDNDILKLVTQVLVGILVYALLNVKYIYNDLGINKFLDKRKEG